MKDVEKRISVMKAVTAKTEKALAENGSPDRAKEVRELGDKTIQELKDKGV